MNEVTDNVEVESSMLSSEAPVVDDRPDLIYNSPAFLDRIRDRAYSIHEFHELLTS